MLGGRGNELDTVHLGTLPPIQLTYLAGVDAPFDQGVAHAKGRQEVSGLGRQLEDGLMIEVVVMIVGKDHRFDRWQFFQADGRLMKTLRAGPLHGRGALGEHRVCQPEFIPQLEQYGGMAEAECAVVRRRQQRGARQRLNLCLLYTSPSPRDS